MAGEPFGGGLAPETIHGAWTYLREQMGKALGSAGVSVSWRTDEELGQCVATSLEDREWMSQLNDG